MRSAFVCVLLAASCSRAPEQAPCFEPVDCESGSCSSARTGLASDPWSVRRLSKLEYSNSIKDAFALNEVDASALPDDDPTRLLSTAVTSSEILAYGMIADQIGAAAAQRAVRECLGIECPDIGCPTIAGQDIRDEDLRAGCIEAEVRSWGKQLYRRPLDDWDMSELGELCHSQRKLSRDLVFGLTRVASVMLQSPRFLYVTERGLDTGSAPSANARALGDAELAARLALALWQAPPDDELLASAAGGSLATRDGLSTEVGRMLASPKASEMVSDHIVRWLAPELLGPTAAGEQSGAETAEQETLMLEQLERFSAGLFQDDASLDDFLRWPVSPINAGLADLYGMEIDDEDFKWSTTADRYGLLTLPAFLAAKATPEHTSIVRRGLFVSEQLLCQPVPPPPNGVAVSIPPPVEGETTRERYARHASDPVCAGCHAQIDPLGFAFEHYDQTGAFRTDEAGLSIDASGSVWLDNEAHDYDGIAGLVDALAASDTVRRCWTRSWVTRMLPAAAPETIEPLVATLTEQTTNKTPLRTLLAEIVTSDRFREVHRPRFGN